MKKFIYLISLCFLVFTSAQIQDLTKIIGENNILVSENMIYNNDRTLYGYMYIYTKDKIDKYTFKYEYLILDRNLNKIASNSFEQKLYRFTIPEYSCKKIGDDILLTIDYKYLKSVYFGNNIYFKYLVTTNRFISLKENTVSNEFYFQDETFKDLKDIPMEDGNLKKAFKVVDNIFSITPIDNKNYSGYLVTENYKEAKDNYKINKLQLFNINKKINWTYEFNKNADEKNYQNIIYSYYPDEKVIFIFAKMKKDKFLGLSISQIDLKTGAKNFDYEIENENSQYNHSIFEIKKYNNTIYVTGTYCKYDDNRFDWENRLGLFRIVLENGKLISKDYLPWNAANKFIEIKDNGKLDGGYRLNTQDFFIFKDGSISYLSEKYKEAGGIAIGGFNARSKSTDMVLLNMDSKFQIKSVNVIEKAKTKDFNYDYLFSQYTNDFNGCIFFFKDYKKDSTDNEKKWFLGINRFFEGKYNYEQIPITSTKEKFEILPNPAKEGYILLREYNEKEKYNQIRLEKLNY